MILSNIWKRYFRLYRATTLILTIGVIAACGGGSAGSNSSNSPTNHGGNGGNQQPNENINWDEVVWNQDNWQ